MSETIIQRVQDIVREHFPLGDPQRLIEAILALIEAEKRADKFSQNSSD